MSARTTALALAALLVSPIVASAQEARPNTEERKPPALLVRPDPEKPSLPLRIVAAKYDTVILGQVASTTLDLTFRSEHDRVLEGELVLPLANGATISGLALEFEGKLRWASVVEREKARVVFEEVVRRGIDPGLVEWVKGNVFRTRVYPIPAKGTKRVVLQWQELLPRDASGAANTYECFFPLSKLGTLEDFSCDVRGASPMVSIAWSAPGKAERGITETPIKFGWHLEGKNTTDRARGDLVVSAVTRGDLVLVEPAKVPVAGKSLELAWVVQVPVPSVPATKTLPKKVTVLWDASGSMSARDKAKERAFLEAYLAALGEAQVKLVVFSNDVWALGELVFDVKDGKCPALLSRIDAIRPDGGTRFSCLDLKKLDARTDAFLLFTDGLATFGEGDPILGEKPVSCIASGASLDLSTLDRIARGGALVDLNTTTPVEGAQRALEPPLVFMGATVDGARVGEVYPQAPARVSGGTFGLAGRLSRGEPVKMTVRFGRGGVEVGKTELTLDPSSGLETGKVERVWATKKVDALMLDAAKNEDEVVRTAKAHGIVTPFTSLLVLDRLEDYVRYRIVPPQEMKDEWEKQIEQQKAAKGKERDEILAQLRAKWQARLAWWKKDFTYPADFKYVDPSKAKAEPDGGAGGGGGGEQMRRLSRDGDSSDTPAPEAAPRPAPMPNNAGPARGRAASPTTASASSEAKKADDGSSEGEGRSSIQLKAWDPKTPYLEAIRKGKDVAEAYEIYLDQRANYVSSTAFFLDCADFFYEKKDAVLAQRVLSNVAEMKLESAPLLRILAYRLQQAGATGPEVSKAELELAIATFQQVTKLKPEEPQSWRDLGLCYARAGKWQDAVANLEKVCLGRWDGRFPDVELIALGELNDTLARAANAGSSGKLSTLPEDLLTPMQDDLRVILTWDADACDMDLWVTEPSGEKAFYGHTATTIGGNFGKDFTQGYGPEEYLLKKAMPGTYKIQVNYYGNHQQIIAGATTIQILVIKNYGRPDEERLEVTRRLKDAQEVLDVFDVSFGK